MSGTPLTIVIADGHAVVRQGLRLLLEAEDDLAVVGESSDVQETCGLLRERTPSVVLLDLHMGRELSLRRALAGVTDDYELILIDCPPSLGLLTVNALVASDRALITAEAQYFSLRGVEQAMEVVELARDSLNPDLSLLGVLLNLADMRTIHSREALASLKERFGEQVFETVIRASIAYAESAERARSILDYRPDLGADYVALAGELLERMPGLGEARVRVAQLAQSSPT